MSTIKDTILKTNKMNYKKGKKITDPSQFVKGMKYYIHGITRDVFTFEKLDEYNTPKRKRRMGYTD